MALGDDAYFPNRDTQHSEGETKKARSVDSLNSEDSDDSDVGEGLSTGSDDSPSSTVPPTLPHSSDTSLQTCDTTTPQSSKTKTQADTPSSQPDSTTSHSITESPGAEGKGKQGTKSKTETKKDSKSQSRAEVPKKEKCPWRDGVFEVYTLEGHNDIVLAVDCTEEYILSGR